MLQTKDTPKEFRKKLQKLHRDAEKLFYDEAAEGTISIYDWILATHLKLYIIDDTLKLLIKKIFLV